MRYNVILTVAAERDLEGIFYYVTDTLSEPQIAKKLLANLRRGVESLSEMPERHAVVSKSKNIRRLMVHGYAIFYRIDRAQEKVLIVRILQGRRQWQDYIE